MDRPPESLKTFANRMAQMAFSESAAQMVRLLRLSGLLQGATTQDHVDEANPEHVGIWERKTENGQTCFVRRMDAMNEWLMWANLGRIEAKSAKRRVLFIGESVARGYLYDPEFNPALALRMILEAQFGENEIEVIDLARTNLAYEVRELAIAALQLEPDIAIIFSGNNYSVSTPQLDGIAELDQALSKDGMAGAKRISDEHIATRARRVACDVSRAYAQKGIPLIWIIPEFNLGDWRDPIINAPHLPEGLNAEWLVLLQEAHNALRDEDFSRAKELAQRVVEIDRGVCVAGLYILAECSRQTNDFDAQRKYLELARDASSWDPSITFVPRPYSVTQQVLREEMTKHGNQIVDLPVLFKEYLNGRVPDRRLFLDYCHLTTEGIQIAMAAAAACVLRSLKNVETPWYALVADHIAPSPETEAGASFLAAIHNAHRWQSYDVVRHFALRALKRSPDVAELMVNYIDLQTRYSVPIRMSKAEEMIFKDGSPLIHHYLFGNNDKRLDRLLLDAINEALEEVGIDARERLARLRREEHSVKLRDINLLDYYYCSAAQQPQELSGLFWAHHKDRLSYDVRYYRAYWPESNFIFIGEANCPLQFCLTCRLPETASGEDTISLTINGKPQVEIVIGREWTTWDINVAGDVVQDGINEVAVCWPVPDFPGQAALDKVADDLCAGKFPDFYAVFGEIHSFTVSSELKVSTNPPVVQSAPAFVEVS
jgi:hypothetical protein